MIEPYTHTQMSVMIGTYIDTCSDDELMMTYSTVFDGGEFDDMWYDQTGEYFDDHYDDDDEESERSVDCVDIEKIRDNIRKIIIDDLRNDMRFVPIMMGWVFGLDYRGTEQNSQGIFIYKFDDGTYEIDGKTFKNNQ